MGVIPLYKLEYPQICRELEKVHERITELPKGEIHAEKHGKYVEHYHEWFEEGEEKARKQRKYVKKADVESLKKKIGLRKRLEQRQDQLIIAKDYYQNCLQEIKLDPEKILKEDQERRRALQKHREVRQKAIEEDPFHSNIHVTLKEEFVRSKGEVIIGNMLFFLRIQYDYEKKQWIGGEWIAPDFTIYYKGRVIYWEHVGLLSDEKYRKRWEKKREAYARAGIMEGVNLIITYGHNGIDSVELMNLIDQYILSIV